MNKWWRVLLIVAVLVSLFRPKTAHACSCIEPDSPATSFPRAGAVFHGRVRAVDDTPLRWVGGLMPLPDVFDNLYYQRVRLDVIESWKGVTTTSATVLTGYGGGDCGYHFNAGDEYIVYAFESNGDWISGICTRTAPISAASDDLAYLATLTPLILTTTSGWSWVIAVGILLIVIVLILGGRRWSRNRET